MSFLKRYRSSDEEIQAHYDQSMALVDEMIAWNQVQRSLAINSLASLSSNGHSISISLAVKYRKNLLSADEKDIEAHLLDLVIKDKQKFNTIMVMINFLKRFYEFTISTGKMEHNFFVNSSMKRKITEFVIQNFAGTMAADRIVKVPNVLALRKFLGCTTKLPYCTILEIALSAGPRLNEILQLRCNNINFSERPVDQLENRPSIYCGGSIQITPVTSVIKNKKPRKVYMSKLAARLLKIWMVENNLDTNTNLPIFPFPAKSASADICKIVKKSGIFASKIKDPVTTEEKTCNEMLGFLGIDFNNIERNVTQEYISKGNKTNKELKRTIDALGITDLTAKFQRVEEVDEGLSCHRMRHCAAMIHFHRNFYGGRNDLLNVKKMLGHANLVVTEIYLKAAEFYKMNDREWKELLIGNGTEYIGLFNKHFQATQKAQILFPK